MNKRRFLLASLVLLASLGLPSCGVTQWQRDQDTVQDSFAELNSPDMQRRIDEARGVKVAR